MLVLRTSFVAFAACGGGESPADAYDGPCWPLPSEPGGEVELGTGDLIFEPMPDVLDVTANASQSDPFLAIHSRIDGLPPGNPEDPFDPSNPRTKVSAVIPELGLTLGVECPSTLGYVESPAGDTFDLIHSLRIGFGAFPLADLEGVQATVTVEVVGTNRLYTRAEKTVTLSVPIGVNAAP
jgi:hypothetical protein